MTSDIHALSGAYAIDALDDIERARFERHLAECGECRAEVDSLREAAGLLPETTTAEPPAALRDRILAEVATVRPLPPIVPAADSEPTVEPGGFRGRRRWLAPLVAAAAVVAVLGAGGVAWHPWTDESGQGPVTSAADRVRNAPDAVTVTRKVDGGEATIIASRSLNQLVVSTEGLPPLPAGKVYEMWLNDADKGMVPVPGGLMTAADSTVVLDGNVSHATGAGITVEPAGGSKVPTSEPVALFNLENA
jgi:anti-sigma-K factor RskA